MAVTSLDALKEIFARNLNAILDETGAPPAGYGRIKHLAGVLDIGTSTAGKWLGGTSLPEITSLVELCSTFNCSMDELFGRGKSEWFTSEGHLLDGLSSLLPRFGGQCPDEPRIAYFDSASGIDSDADVHMFRVDSNSMEPFVVDGDWVAFICVDQVDTDGVFLFAAGKRVYVRRVQTQTSGDLILIPENRRYEPETIPASRVQTFDVIGQIVARILVGR